MPLECLAESNKILLGGIILFPKCMWFPQESIEMGWEGV